MAQVKDLRDFDSYIELVNHFTDEQVCIDHLVQLRWAGVPTCPYCGCQNVYTIKGKNPRWQCKQCKESFTVKTATIFENSPIKLRLWFMAMYLNSAHKKGISSHQLARDLKITQKSAWFMLHRIRVAASPDEEPFSNEVEIDETYIGGKEKNKHANKRTGKTQGRSTQSKAAVLGILERDGKVYAVPVEDAKAKTILPIIKEKVEKGSTIYTDDLKSYRALGKDYTHEIVNHSAKEYVNGKAHTQSIESFWATVKRTIVGTYHHVSKRHLGAYTNEFSFRFNNRKMTDGSRFDVLLANVSGKRLTYKNLIAK